MQPYLPFSFLSRETNFLGGITPTFFFCSLCASAGPCRPILFPGRAGRSTEPAAPSYNSRCCQTEKAEDSGERSSMHVECKLLPNGSAARATLPANQSVHREAGRLKYGWVIKPKQCHSLCPTATHAMHFLRLGFFRTNSEKRSSRLFQKYHK
uniref:Uncharacterized protein n=1 Tax=Astyanax mexicanus TaxID=7994 RepID=A0A3B1IFR1_ASTMX